MKSENQLNGLELWHLRLGHAKKRNAKSKAEMHAEDMVLNIYVRDKHFETV